MDALHRTLEAVGFDPGAVDTAFVEHHLAHASSAFHFSGFPSAAILTADGEGEVTSTLLAEGLPDGRIEKTKEMLKPDSLGHFYSTMNEYLGFQSMDGEYKVMGIAPYGDPARCDLAAMVRITPDGFRCDDSRVWVARKHRVAPGKHYSPRLLQELGPPRTGDAGIALGAASYAAVARGESVRPMTHVALGPAYAPEQVREVLDRLRIPHERVRCPEAVAADLLARGEIVAWFQGRMGWGPRALGQRSILGNPTIKGTADEVNRRIKFREPWRPSARRCWPSTAPRCSTGLTTRRS